MKPDRTAGFPKVERTRPLKLDQVGVELDPDQLHHPDRSDGCDGDDSDIHERLRDGVAVQAPQRQPDHEREAEA